jgi:copper chaperone CopZ
VAVRSALLKVPGVTRVQVSLETSDAVVTYDPRVAKVESLVAAVDAAPGPISERQYLAEVKVGPRPASPR